MYDKLSVVRNIITVTGCSGNSLAGLADLAVGSVSNYLRGQQVPDAEKLEKLYQTARAVEKLDSLAAFDFTKLDRVRPLIENIIKGGSVSVVVTEPPTQTEPLFSIFTGSSYFSERKKNELGVREIHSTRAPGNAPAFIRQDAGHLKALLIASGYRAQVVPSKEEYPTDPESVWGESLEAAPAAQ